MNNKIYKQKQHTQ